MSRLSTRRKHGSGSTGPQSPMVSRHGLARRTQSASLEDHTNDTSSIDTINRLVAQKGNKNRVISTFFTARIDMTDSEKTNLSNNIIYVFGSVGCNLNMHSIIRCIIH